MPEFKSFADSRKEGRRKKIVLLVVVAACIVAGALVFWRMRRPSEAVPLPDFARQVVDARSAAQYGRALQLVAEARKLHSDTPAIRSLSDDFERDLKPDIRLHYLTRGILPSRGPGLGPGPQLTPDDEFYFTVN